MDGHVAGYDDFVQELTTLISTFPPPFIYIYDPISLRTTGTVLISTVAAAARDANADNALIYHVHIDAITCFSQRLLFDTILTALQDDMPDFEAPERWNDSWDSFIHGLQHLHAHKSQESGKDVRFVVSIEHAHRLKERLPESIVPLARLKELSLIDITVILLSPTQWQDIKPPLGASPDPYYIDIKPLRKEDIITTLSSRFTSISQQATTSSSSSSYSRCYSPSLQSLYKHYISMICDVCYPFTHDIDDLAYIAAARWPGFVKPILSAHHPTKGERERERESGGEEEEEEEEIIAPPSEDTRLRLIRAFTPTITNALESLQPRLQNAFDWAGVNDPDPKILSHLSSSTPITSVFYPSTPMSMSMSRVDMIRMSGASVAPQERQERQGLAALPRMSKFILIASYIASTNPPKTDLRMFGRGLDEKKRKRRRNVRVQGKTKGPSKVPQHLLGPTPFPMDRMLAILGALLEENDVDSRLPTSTSEMGIPGEYTDMEINRVGVYNAIMELVSMHLLVRTSQQDRIDGPPMFKSMISLEMVMGLAKQLDVPLNDLLWETM